MVELGVALTQAGRVEEALSRLTEARTIFRESRKPLWEATALLRLGEAHFAARKPTLAMPFTERALSQLRFSGRELTYAEGLTMFGRALAGTGRAERARACWVEALSIYERVGTAEAERVRELLCSLPRDESGDDG
jgi:hypothetical protein